MIAEEVLTQPDVLAFRLRYNMPPNDPRLLALTEEEVALDLELGLAVREDALARQCDQCGAWTYRTECPICPGQPPLTEGERLAARERAGERVDWDEYNRKVWGDRPPGVSTAEWERRKREGAAAA